MADDIEVVTAPAAEEGVSDVLKEDDLKEPYEGGSGPPSPTGSAGDMIGSDGATGVGSLVGQDQMDDLSDDVSDTGWDTDLEIEEEKEEYDVTGGKLYIKTCETLGIIPASYFLRTIQAQESAVNLRHHGVGPKGAKAIAVALTPNTNVTHLDLSDNGLGTEGAIAITAMMKENCYITHMDLSDNDMGPPAAYAIAPMVTINSTLVHLGLSGNGFNNKAAEPLAELIRGSYHIQYLDLSHNEFGEEAGVILGPALADCEVMQTIDISWNHIRRKGAAALADGLKNNQSLKVVSLAYNGFDNQGAVALADALKVNSTLEELDISNNRICTDGAIVLSKVLPLNDTLRELKIGQNPLQIPGVIAFLDAVKVCSGTSLQSLSFEGMTVTLAIEKTIQELSESHGHLTISHGGTGGYKHPQPKKEPIEKLDAYCKENNVVLLDLFRSFDKEQDNSLSEEDFRSALKHISAPLMEFERQNLIKEFAAEPPPKPLVDGEPEPVPETKSVAETKPVAKSKSSKSVAKSKSSKSVAKTKSVAETEEPADTPPAFVNYPLLVETAKALKTTKPT